MSKKITFLILSGPTREYIDPVRYISNESSGKMGNALVEAVLENGYEVIFVSGPVNKFPKNIKPIKVIATLEMFREVKTNFRKADIIISVAAVADYRPLETYKHKLKKDCLKSIKLKQNRDIVKYCGENKKNQVVVGFALETKDLIKNAKLKLKNKNLDLIVANDKTALNSNRATAYIVSDKGVAKIKNMTKKTIAGKIIHEAIRIFENIKSCKNIS
ncbi:MAG: phosphopantothenoylcysteine decarboxylase [Endomicrobium sp.]|nr:phosphopantothenoylcysteine decarboxylase [Endomicrobium sp.]